MAAERRVAICTGATGAIGRHIAEGLVRAGFTTVLTCRDEARGRALVESVAKAAGDGDVRLEVVDLASIASIKAFTARVASVYPAVSVLVNNAAVVPRSRETTVDGIEKQFGVNVLAYYLLMTGLEGPLRAGAPSRIVNVASNYAGGLDLNDVQFTRRSYDENAAYQASKQADRMLTVAAAEVFKGSGVTVNACHPGVVTSPLLKNLGMRSGFETADKGAATPLFLATDPSVTASGKYFQDSRPKHCKFGADKAKCDQLWELCAGLAE
uniref:Retinol dehydrogenase 14 n=1 Tax=Bicosoecida sp. CB-2014 TaxID=1486930 RepID=A0A7S1CNG9_9STRA|mmetsp:Transcript_7142/g.25459  ORF Transcript_7142/g.25459 Transcript_7142/m.25459 type:complete len:268 (+) Transcript_7142:154-957(+)